jgi:penicillin amidase
MLLLGPGCSGSKSEPGRIEDLPVAGEIKLERLSGPVEVVTDVRGMRHIYGQSETDVIAVQGYLMARDRMAQMEFLRRAVEGRLAEVAYSAYPGLLDMDIGARFIGFGRLGAAIYDSLSEGDEIKAMLDAFSAGVNAYLAELRAGTARLPGGIDALLHKDHLTDWSGADTLAIARYMSYDLSRSLETELDMTEARAAIAEVFPAASADPARAARAGLFLDFWSFSPGEPVFTREGIPNWPTDNGTVALRSPARPAPAFWPDRALLARARAFLAQSRLPVEMRGAHGGSNNWVVHGSLTRSGFPLLANDPHLGLDSPPKFWYVHLNTRRAGGDMDAQGLSLAGAPGILLGYNDSVAWGLTTAVFDVQDVYQETIVPGAGGNPDSVQWKGQTVPIEKRTETIALNNGQNREVTFEVVPHHGAIIPDSRTTDAALSVRWTGNDVSNELRAVSRLMKARDASEVENALDFFEVGAQSFVVVSRDGDIFWSTQSKVPLRDPRALTYDPVTQSGLAPAFVLPGSGEYEWIGTFVDEKYIPHDLNPAKGFIATANQDLVGLTADGNPFNDAVYLGFDWDVGHRMARITHRLEDLLATGKARPEDMIAIQADDRSVLGAKLAAAIVAELDRAEAEAAHPGTHPDLAAAVAAAGADLPAVLALRDRLEAWRFSTPPAVEGAPSQAEIDESVATSIFNAIVPRLVRLSFGDEVEAIGVRPGDDYLAKTLQWALLEPQRLATYDDSVQDTVLWDDLATPERESRGDRVLRAAHQAHVFLSTTLGTEPTGWRWGKLHRVTFKTLIPFFDAFNIPQATDPEFPDGFPRHGDNFGVDASHTGLWDETDFTYGSGPQQRLVVEMTDRGPRVWNAIAGGEVHDYLSPHHADEAQYWRKNEAPPLFFHEKDVVQNAETRERFAP